jgi:hypothetical protein
MAENKKGVIVYADWIDKFEGLTDEEAGKLIKHFFRYVNDLNPEAPDRITKLLFIDIKNTLKRDLKKYENKKEERSNAGKLGNLKKYNEDLYDLVISKKITLKIALEQAEYRKTSHSDTKDTLANKTLAKLAVSDSVSVSDSVNKYNTTKQTEAEVDFLQIGTWIKEISKSPVYLEGIYGSQNLEKGSVSELLNNFKNHLKVYPKKHNNFSDFKKHFASWLNIKNNKGELSKYQKNTKGQL